MEPAGNWSAGLDLKPSSGRKVFKIVQRHLTRYRLLAIENTETPLSMGCRLVLKNNPFSTATSQCASRYGAFNSAIAFKLLIHDDDIPPWNLKIVDRANEHAGNLELPEAVND